MNSGVSSLVTNGVNMAMDCNLTIFHNVIHLENLYSESLKMMNALSVVSNLFDFAGPK
jgi:hypothetical protein